MPTLLFEFFYVFECVLIFLFSKSARDERDTFSIHNQEILLVEAIRRDKNKFESLYNSFFDRIFRFAFHRVSNEYIAEEITSSVFIKAYTAIDRFEYRNCSISAWLFKITVNEINLYFRKNNHQLRNVSLHVADTEGLFEDLNIEDQSAKEIALLAKAIERLNEDEVQFIELRYFENYSFKEIGFFLNITPDNAKTKTYRILEKLKGYLIDLGHGKD